jgi:putative glycosyltransferase (TIGR04372 family)
MNILTHYLKRLIDHLLYILFFFPALLFLLIVFVLKNKFKIKWYCLISTRIGHFISEPIIYFSKPRGLNEKTIFYTRPTVSNKYVLKILKNKFLFFPHTFLHTVQQIVFFLEKFNLKIFKDNYISSIETNYGRDLNSSIYNNNIDFKLPKKDIHRAKKILKDNGINLNKKFVCLYVRDSEYLHKEFRTSKARWAYHDYRDWNVNKFNEGIKFLNNNGYTVVRISKYSKFKINDQTLDVIDLPFEKFRSDFIEVFFSYICDFAVGTDPGSLHLSSTLFKKPYLGFITPIGHIHSYFENSLFSSKRIILKSTNKELTFKEIINNNLHNFLDKADIADKFLIQELDSQEINDTIKEFYLRINNLWISNKADSELQNKFWDLFPKNIKSSDGANYHQKVKCQFSSTFLSRNQNWLK